jgi:predicted nucleic acid-binding Zn ribbon protein
MPPIYNFICETCNEETEIIRSIKDSDSTPTEDEAKEKEPCGKQHKWKKIIKYAPEKAYGAGWNTRKGYH